MQTLLVAGEGQGNGSERAAGVIITSSTAAGRAQLIEFAKNAPPSPLNVESGAFATPDRALGAGAPTPGRTCGGLDNSTQKLAEPTAFPRLYFQPNFESPDLMIYCLFA